MNNLRTKEQIEADEVQKKFKEVQSNFQDMNIMITDFQRQCNSRLVGVMYNLGYDEKKLGLIALKLSNIRMKNFKNMNKLYIDCLTWIEEKTDKRESN